MIQDVTPYRKDRILVVEENQAVGNFIARQALAPAGYETQVVAQSGLALAAAAEFQPDLIIANLSLAGLSGKDLLVALASAGIETPVIVLSEKGAEAGLAQAFRLGAADYLLWPVREAEVLQAVERVMQQVHGRREREQLAHQLSASNAELQNRIRALTSLFAVGKAVASITDQALLFERILAEALALVRADLGWFLMRPPGGGRFVLAAHQGLPAEAARALRQPWDDGISSLVAASGEPLSLWGSSLQPFKASNLGQAVLVLPVKVQSQVIAVLTLMRTRPEAFSDADRQLLEAMADTISISLVNAGLFRAIEERSQSVQAATEQTQLTTKIFTDLLQAARQEIDAPLAAALQQLEHTQPEAAAEERGPSRRWLGELRHNLLLARQALAGLELPPAAKLPAGKVELNRLLSQAVMRFQAAAAQRTVSVFLDMPETALEVSGDAALLGYAFDSLVGHALQAARSGGRVSIALQSDGPHTGRVTVTEPAGPLTGAGQAAGPITVSLAVAKEIVAYHKGQMWTEGEPGQGARYHCTFQLVQAG